MKGKVAFLMVGVIAFFSLQGVSYVKPMSQETRPVVFTAELNTEQEVPAPGPSSGIGAAIVGLNADHSVVSFAITFTDLTGLLGAAHFHVGIPGEAGPVVRTICGGPAPPDIDPTPCPDEFGTVISGVWSSTDEFQPLTDQLVQVLLDGGLYINLHTDANPAGEIRGQVVAISPINGP